MTEASKGSRNLEVDSSCEGTANTPCDQSKAETRLVRVFLPLVLLVTLPAIGFWLWDRFEYKVPKFIEPSIVGIGDPFANPGDWSMEWQVTVAVKVSRLRDYRRERILKAKIKKITLPGSRWIYSYQSTSGATSHEATYDFKRISRIGTIEFRDKNTAVTRPSIFNPDKSEAIIYYDTSWEWITISVDEESSSENKLSFTFSIQGIDDSVIQLQGLHRFFDDPEPRLSAQWNNFRLTNPDKAVINGKTGNELFEELPQIMSQTKEQNK